MRIGSIYTLTDPRDNQTFWVGQTTLTPRRRRLLEHLSQARCGHAHQPLDKIREIAMMDGVPVFSLVENDVPYNALGQREEAWIIDLRRRGAPLCNKAIGAGSAKTTWSLSEETREKLRAVPHTWGDRISLAKRGLLVTPQMEFEIRELYRDGATKAQLMRRYSLGYRAVRRVVG